MARFLHSAAGMKNYMVIIGGRLDHHEFDNSILAYCYACNTWTNISEGGNFNTYTLVNVGSVSQNVGQIKKIICLISPVYCVI